MSRKKNIYSMDPDPLPKSSHTHGPSLMPMRRYARKFNPLMAILRRCLYGKCSRGLQVRKAPAAVATSWKVEMGRRGFSLPSSLPTFLPTYLAHLLFRNHQDNTSLPNVRFSCVRPTCRIPQTLSCMCENFKTLMLRMGYVLDRERLETQDKCC